MAKKPTQTFTVFRNGEFWMYARGKSAKQLRHSIWWLNRGNVPKQEIEVEPTPTREDGKPLFTHRRELYKVDTEAEAADRHGMGGHQSARMGKDEWLTPPDIITAVGPFDLDVCAPVIRPWDMAARHYTRNQDGLLLPWSGRVWCNPPYGRVIGKWLAKCAEHGNAMALIFARTETAHWDDHVWKRAHAILFIRGRLHFHHVDGSRAEMNAGAPSALVAYDAANTVKLKSSGIPGRIVIL